MNRTISPTDVWHNPEQISRVLEVVTTSVQKAGLFEELYDMSDVGKYDRTIQVVSSLWKLSDRITDGYLSLGAVGLFKNWGILVERPDEANEGNWRTGSFGDLDGFAGAICLASRHRSERVTSPFNGISLHAHVTTHPKVVVMNYMEQLDRRRQRGWN